MSEQHEPISREKFDRKDRIKHAEDSLHLDNLDKGYYEDALGVKMVIEKNYADLAAIWQS